MADIVFADHDQTDAGSIDFELIELLFFAYRDFVGEADQTLDAFGFGRAHHRVLHFVNRNPGMRVTDLLDLLRITKQSLGRVLKQLVDDGYIEQEPGLVDRRERRLRATDRGRALALDLARRQSIRIGRALGRIGPAARPHVRDFLSGMIDPRGRPVLED
jgi:DNA-binding MarR family transcriptional regulator